MIGLRLNNYEVVSLLGEGGMGTVYLARHTFMGRRVAIKFLRP
jgi:serine/threonine protein kinase